MHPNPRRIIPVIFLLAIAGGLWWYFTRPAGSADAKIAAGTIEALSVNIAPELGGRVVSVSAEEGQSVQAGEVLIQFDTTLLETQRRQAGASLEAVRANHAAAEAGLAAARANFELLQAGPSEQQLAVAQTGVDRAQLAVDAAQDAYDALPVEAQAGPDGRALKQQVDLAKAALANAKAQYELTAAGARAEQLQTAQAQVAVAQAQVNAAAAQASAAQAAVEVFDVQILKLTLRAPSAGVVLARAIQPGEVASPGAVLFVLGQLQPLNITVYVPETRYGTLSLGQQARVSVDSYPGEMFAATVTHIADQAEFTPRNVQTAEGRQTTVFAVKLTIDNAAGRLKPGMPADVTFEQ